MTDVSRNVTVIPPQSILTSSSVQLELSKLSVQPSKVTITLGQASAEIDLPVNVAQEPLTATTVGQPMTSLRELQTVPSAAPSHRTTGMATSAMRAESPTSVTMPAMALATGVTSQESSGTTRVVPADVCLSSWTLLLMSMATVSVRQAKAPAMTLATAEPVGQSTTQTSGSLRTQCVAASLKLSIGSAAHVARTVPIQTSVAAISVTTATRVGHWMTLLLGSHPISLADVCLNNCLSVSILTETNALSTMLVCAATTATTADGLGPPLTLTVQAHPKPCADATGGDHLLPD